MDKQYIVTVENKNIITFLKIFVPVYYVSVIGMPALIASAFPKVPTFLQNHLTFTLVLGIALYGVLPAVLILLKKKKAFLTISDQAITLSGRFSKKVFVEIMKENITGIGASIKEETGFAKGYNSWRARTYQTNLFEVSISERGRQTLALVKKTPVLEIIDDLEVRNYPLAIHKKDLLEMLEIKEKAQKFTTIITLAAIFIMAILALLDYKFNILSVFGY